MRVIFEPSSRRRMSNPTRQAQAQEHSAEHRNDPSDVDGQDLEKEGDYDHEGPLLGPPVYPRPLADVLAEAHERGQPASAVLPSMPRFTEPLRRVRRQPHSDQDLLRLLDKMATALDNYATHMDTLLALTQQREADYRLLLAEKDTALAEMRRTQHTGQTSEPDRGPDAEQGSAANTTNPPPNPQTSPSSSNQASSSNRKKSRSNDHRRSSKS